MVGLNWKKVRAGRQNSTTLLPLDLTQNGIDSPPFISHSSKT